MNDSIFAMLFGVLGTVLFHVGKSMQKQGIAILGILRKKYLVRDGTVMLRRRDEHDGLIYLCGIILNNTIALWIMLSNLFAPSSYFTSMFGVGLIALLLYSRIVLHETITGGKFFGMLLIAVGTFMLGMEGLHRKRITMAEIDTEMVAMVISLYIAAAVLFMIVAYASGRGRRIALATGIFTGGLASLDPVLKGIGQHYGGGIGLVPSTAIGWVPFAASFIFSTASFIIAQLGFARNAPLTVQVSTSTSVYICFPVVILGLALPGYMVTRITLLGLFIEICGILSVFGFRIPMPSLRKPGNGTWRMPSED